MEILSFPPQQQMEVVDGGEYKTFTGRQGGGELGVGQEGRGTSGAGVQIAANPDTILLLILILRPERLLFWGSELLVETLLCPELANFISCQIFANSILGHPRPFLAKLVQMDLSWQFSGVKSF